ncbi:hypothetical protein CRE_02033 [Caenorhabditis remanei]|uniref:Uncharacterized protein n=1 Tax=Caenorhabditis remanei TaxID=31234 RepID=E3LGX9_CAERE|nr:hypothetical protein CRE_02033 [Caenorhabditis remanei]
MRLMKLNKILLLIVCSSSVFITIYWSATHGIRSSRNTRSNSDRINPVADVKKGNKWIVVTSVNYPTEDVKRLSSFEEWNLVVVADTKTPVDWKLETVHFLSVDYQKQLPFSIVSSLPYKSYTRKNIGYLYAISQGAEWIYDTDDDNKPYDKLGLNQFDYEDTVSGVRYQVKNSSEIIQRLFNPYRFFGVDQMWPRGFPLEYIEKHTNGKENQVLCYKMKRSSVQQGLVHHDPDVDAVYRLLNADSNSGLDVKFNKFAPPIALSVGTFSPWNSQNTLFHKSAFHTLFLPTTVSFRTTDIWRSFISQKILHLSGLTVSFAPTNAIQFRNAHDYLKDFKDEKQVYEDSGKIIEFLNDWKCSKDINLEDCINNLSEDLVENNLWGEDDSKLMKLFLDDLKLMGFKYPDLMGEEYEDPYIASDNETDRNVNCRRMNLEFELIDPKKYDQENIRKAEQKLNYFGDLVDWCNETGYSNLSKSFPSAKQLSEKHEESYVLQQDKNSVCSLNSSIFKPKYSIIKVLIAVNNYPWKYGVGLIQRLYQPYFAAVIFCGSWYSDEVIDVDNYTSTLNPINYIHMNPAEIHKGYFAYHCVTLVKEMRLNNVKGYFLVADDTIFNIWQRIDYSRVHHLMGPVAEQHGNNWWNGKHGIPAAKNIVLTIKNNTDPKIEKAWKQFDEGLKTYGYMKDNQTVFDEIASGKGKSISDFFYIPTSQSEYYAVLMRVFYENLFFLELAVNKFVKSVDHQVARKGRRAYLWGNRNNWDTYYSKQMVAMHPIKTSQFRNATEKRKKYCGSVLQTWSDIIFGGSQNFTVKADDDPDRTVE